MTRATATITSLTMLLSAFACKKADTVPAPEHRPPDPNLAVELMRTTVFVSSSLPMGLGGGEQAASQVQADVAATFTPEVSQCVTKAGMKGEFGVMLLVAPDRAEIPYNGWKSNGDFPEALSACLKPVYDTGRMPESERFAGLLIMDYRVK